MTEEHTDEGKTMTERYSGAVIHNSANIIRIRDVRVLILSIIVFAFY